jgi:hypothetical protein
VSFEKLRAVGAFLISSKLVDRKVAYVQIMSEKGAACQIKNPWGSSRVQLIRNGKPEQLLSGEILTFETQPDERIELKAAQ